MNIELLCRAKTVLCFLRMWWPLLPPALCRACTLTTLGHLLLMFLSLRTQMKLQNKGAKATHHLQPSSGRVARLSVRSWSCPLLPTLRQQQPMRGHHQQNRITSSRPMPVQMVVKPHKVIRTMYCLEDQKHGRFDQGLHCRWGQCSSHSEAVSMS